jgi:integrase
MVTGAIRSAQAMVSRQPSSAQPRPRLNATALLRRSAVVRDIVGHSDIEVTTTIYVSLDEKRKALRTLGDALG